jgi:uncharacterized phage protein (TIGR01671 family)
MRVFKFRGWSAGVQRMTYFDKPIISSTELREGEKWGMFFPSTMEGGVYLSGYQAIMPFAGFHDKNGKEVYDGDLVTAWSQGSFGTFIIKWREDGGGSPCYILYPAWQGGQMWSISASREKDGKCYDRGLEVIGNIYENPKILKGIKYPQCKSCSHNDCANCRIDGPEGPNGYYPKTIKNLLLPNVC